MALLFSSLLVASQAAESAGDDVLMKRDEVVSTKALSFVGKVLGSLFEVQYGAVNPCKNLGEVCFRPYRFRLLSEDVHQFLVDSVDSDFRIRIGRDQDLALRRGRLLGGRNSGGVEKEHSKSRFRETLLVAAEDS
jgi:hypothetical protein